MINMIRDIEVKNVDQLIEWCQNEVKYTEELDNNNKDEWAVSRINALEEVLIHLDNIKALETLI